MKFTISTEKLFNFTSGIEGQNYKHLRCNDEKFIRVYNYKIIDSSLRFKE